MKIDVLKGMVIAASKGTPDALVLQALYQAAREFFAITEVWVHSTEQALTEAGIVRVSPTEYWAELSLPEHTAPVRLLRVTKGADAFVPVPGKLLVRDGKVGVAGPQYAFGDKLWWEASLAPTSVDADIPDALVTIWGPTIQAGATLRLSSGLGGPLSADPGVFSVASASWADGLARAIHTRLREEDRTGSGVPRAKIAGGYV